MNSLHDQPTISFPRLFRQALAALTTACSLQMGVAQVVINELDSDTAGSDVAEFVELFDGGVGNTPLDGMVVVFFNGATSESSRGAYEVFDLDGMATDDAGYFLLANPGVGDVDERSMASPPTGMIFAPGGSGALQNGEDAVALYAGLDAEDIEVSSAPLTRPGDIVLGGTISLLDAVVYQTSSGSGNPDADSGYLGELSISGSVLDENLNGAASKDTASVGRVPDGGNPLDQSDGIWAVLDPPTPGYANAPSFELDLRFSPTSIAEDAGAGALQVTVSRDGDGVGELVVSFTGNDPTELDFPAEVTIPDGEFELVFDVDVLDDGAADGTQTLTITANAPDFFPGTRSVDVVDDGADAPTLVINEICGEVEPGQDPNQDGVTDFVGDEFVEIVNISGGTLDISSWELSDNEGVRHVFPAGSILAPDCAVVVFGGGGFSEGVRADFGNALVQKASSGGLGLNDPGDSIIVRQAGIERAGSAYDDYDAAQGGDLTRVPDLTGDFTSHVLSGTGQVFSPGLRGDNGAPFCTLDESLSLTGAATFQEDGGEAVAQYTLSRSGSTDAALSVRLSTSDASEARFQLATIEIPAGMASVQVPVDAVDDSFVDGDQTLDLTAHATGFVSAFSEIVVTDDGSDSSYILINEIDADSNPGSDTAEFIELYDGGIGGTPLDGYVVVLINGVNDLIYESYDLDGRSTNPDGFFVIGAPGVPNVGLTDLPGSAGFLQNGPGDAVVLAVGNAADFIIGQAFLGTPTDAVLYGGPDEQLELTLGLDGQTAPNTDGETASLSRLPDGGERQDLSGFRVGIPTPGTSNRSAGGDSPYDLWATGFPGIGSKLDDDDGDTLTTIMEYALGKNPLVPDLGGNPIGGGAGTQLQLSVTFGSEAAADPNLSYVIEASTDLNSWSEDDTVIVPGPPGTLTVAYIGATPRAHLRLRVVLE